MKTKAQLNRYDYEFSTEKFQNGEISESDYEGGPGGSERDCCNIIDGKLGGNFPIACAFGRDTAEKIVEALNNAA